MRRLLRRDPVIPGGYIVRALQVQGPSFSCTNCGERMFVRSGSGLCPVCWNGHRPLALPQPVLPVPETLVLAGVIDDPAIEDVSRE